MRLRLNIRAKETPPVCDLQFPSRRISNSLSISFNPRTPCFIVMYIPAVPYTPSNAAYIAKQKESFLKGIPPPDYPFTGSEAGFNGTGTAEDIVVPFGRKAMGFEVEVAA